MSSTLMIKLRELEDGVEWLRDSAEPGEKPEFVPSYASARERTVTALSGVLNHPKLPPEFRPQIETAVNQCIKTYDARDIEGGTPALFVVLDLIWKVRVLFRKPRQVWQ